MSGPQHAADTPVTDRDQLAAWLEQGARPKPDWRIGVEHEKFPFRLDTQQPVPFDGPDGIEALLTGLKRFGWQELREGPHLIALSRDGASLSLEPGGQFELSGAQMDSLHGTADELARHFSEANAAAGELGIGFLGVGYHPTARRQDIPFMPKGRYRIMRDYMPKRGARGLDMMMRTCTAQVNLDFCGERDMVRKLRLALKLQPVAMALFANSPFAEGRPAANLSERAAVWLDVDPDRTGSLPVAFEDGFGFERYVDYALDVPMYFVFRDGRYIDASGQSFRDFIAGKLPALPGETPVLSDWADHLTTIFTEARLKRYIEMRGADVGPPEMILAVSGFWTGLLYDSAALDAAEEVARDIMPEDLPQLRRGAARLALGASVAGRSLKDTAASLVDIAAAGLKARNRLNAMGEDERQYLAPAEAMARSGLTQADDFLARYKGAWNNDITPIFAERRY